MRELPRRTTRNVIVGSVTLGTGSEIALQSMCATKTTNIRATLSQIRLLEDAGAHLIRMAVDSQKDVAALKSIREETSANLVVDLQENYRLAKDVAPYIQKFRYNPGHLHHHQKSVSVDDKVKFLVDVAQEYGCAIRVGVNFGSLESHSYELKEDAKESAVNSALRHSELLEKFGFTRFVVSIKSSNPKDVIAVNTRFSAIRPDIPIHLGVTEAGLLPDGAIKTRIAFEQLLSKGIGDTIRVSLTVPDSEKDKEILIAREILDDIANGRFRSIPDFLDRKLNVISCPSCSRVENHAFVALAQEVKSVTERFADCHKLTIAVMGCRVNGPGETDEADIGLWCAPTHVNLKKGHQLVGAFSYEQIIPRMLQEIESLLEERKGETEE